MSKKSLAWMICLIGVGAVMCPASERATSASGMNLLLITLDTTRADAIGLYGNKNGVSPHIDELGRSGIVFQECYSPVPLTLPAHCSLFTGRYPIGHGVRNNGTYFLDAGELTMAEAFQKQGYETAAFISSFTVFSKFGLSQGFDIYDEDFESGRVLLNFTAEIPADRVYDKFARWLDHQAGQRFFCWVHFYDPHFPYVSHGDAQGQKGQSLWSLYEGEVKFVDGFVGKIREALRAKGLEEKTIVVIVGDHGEAFGEHKEHGHGIFCYDESLRVPLIISHPRIFPKARLVTERVSLVDAMPTLLELYRFKIPPPVQGQSFLKLMDGGVEKQKRMIHFESVFGREECNWAPLSGIIDGRHKYISLPEPELYDLENDGPETHNLFGSHPEISRAMDKRLELFVRNHAATKIPGRRELTESDVEKLKSLGYISSFSGKSKEMIDPKRAIGVYTQVAEIKNLLLQKKYGQAEDQLRAVLSLNQGVELPDIYEISYQIAKQKGKLEEGERILKKAISVFPDREAFKILLATHYLEANDLTQARDFCRQLLAADDKMTAAHILLADAEDRMNNVEASLMSYERAVALEPQNGMIKAKYAGILVRKGELPKAQAVLAELEAQEAVVRSPEYLEAMAGLSQQLLTSGEVEKALAFYEKMTKLDPQNPAVWLNLGGAYFSLRKLDLALENFEKALALDKSFALAYSNIGLVHLSRSMESDNPALLQKALGLFNEAIRLEPGLAAAYNGRAMASFAMNQTSQAVSDYRRAIELDPNLVDAYVNLSVALQQLGQYGEALEYLDKCREKFFAQLPPQEREEIERLYSQIKSLKEKR